MAQFVTDYEIGLAQSVGMEAGIKEADPKTVLESRGCKMLQRWEPNCQLDQQFKSFVLNYVALENELRAVNRIIDEHTDLEGSRIQDSKLAFQLLEYLELLYNNSDKTFIIMCSTDTLRKRLLDRHPKLSEIYKYKKYNKYMTAKDCLAVANNALQTYRAINEKYRWWDDIDTPEISIRDFIGNIEFSLRGGNPQPAPLTPRKEEKDEIIRSYPRIDLMDIFEDEDEYDAELEDVPASKPERYRDLVFYLERE